MIELNTGDQVADLHASTRKRPRPRETKLLQVLASGNARSVSDAMLQAGINPSSTSIRRRLGEGGDLRKQLDKALDAAGLTLPRILNKLAAKIDAQKTIIVDKAPFPTEDNDAQLRAVEQVLKLHDRTGKLPAIEQGGQGASTITVNVLVMAERES